MMKIAKPETIIVQMTVVSAEYQYTSYTSVYSNFSIGIVFSPNIAVLEYFPAKNS